jgi:hypothetical protein
VYFRNRFYYKHKLSYCPQTRTFFWPGDKPWSSGVLTVTKAQNIPALATKVVKVNVVTEQNNTPTKDTIISACVGSETKPLLTSDPGLSTVNEKGQIQVLVKNCSPCDITLERNELIGQAENLQGSDFAALKPHTFCISAIECKPIPPDVKKFMLANTKLTVPESEKV